MCTIVRYVIPFGRMPWGALVLGIVAIMVLSPILKE